MRIRITIGLAAAVLALALGADRADAQWVANRGYNPWTGTYYSNYAVQNPWTGVYTGRTDLFHPWSGRGISYGTAYNPWTGSFYQNRAYQNPWLGRYGVAGYGYNPWTGAYGYRWRW